MRSLLLQSISIAALAIFVSGCGRDSAPGNAKPAASDSDREAAFAKLSDEDRPLAKAQGYCAVTSQPLGSMGPPIKLTVKDEPVFVCCKGCEKKAKASPDKTLAKVAELKAKVQAEGSR